MQDERNRAAFAGFKRSKVGNMGDKYRRFVNCYQRVLKEDFESFVPDSDLRIFIAVLMNIVDGAAGFGGIV